jgi:hypothetical protein
MSYLVDVVQIDAAHADEYLQLVRDLAVPVMSDAGASLAACWSTARDLGEDVDVLVAWSIGDHARWNEIRRDLVLDPRWHRWASAAARLRRGGTRRFYHEAPFAPARR